MTEVINIPETDHSLFGPSSFERAEACTASVIYGALLEEPPSTIWAAQGTACHEVWRLCLTENLEPWEFMGASFRVGEHVVEIDGDHVSKIQVMLDFTRNFKGDTWIERRLTLPGTKSFGRGDFIALGRPMTVADFKSGFIYVPPDAAQLGLYGLMALLGTCAPTYVRDGDMSEVMVNAVVCQPGMKRGGLGLRAHAWTRGALNDLWDRAIALQKDIDEERVRFHVSDKCRYCRVAGSCPALRSAGKDAIMMMTAKDPAVLEALSFDAAALDEALAMMPALALFKTKIEEMAFNYIQNGGQLENGKLVQKLARRHWKNEDDAEAWLVQHVGDRAWQPRALLSPAMSDKVLTKPLRDHAEKHLVEKISSGLTLVGPSDSGWSRPAVVNVQAQVEARKTEAEARRLLANETKEIKHDE